MSLPINYNINLRLTGANGINVQVQSTNTQAPQTLNLAEQIALSIPTGSGVQPTFSSITTPGIVILYNSDPVNFVSYGPYVSGAQKAWGKLYPGQYAFFTLDPTVQMSFIADTAAVIVQVTMLNL